MEHFFKLIGFSVFLFLSFECMAGTTYIHTDALGSVVAESNSSGVITKRIHYYPYGDTIESPTDGISYSGHFRDADTNLIYMGARYYDPVIGRFISNDPVDALTFINQGNVHGFNRYAYANNNPYKYTDPNGESPVIIGGAGAGCAITGPACPVGAAVGGIVGGVATIGIVVVAVVTNDSPDSGGGSQEGAPDLPEGLVGEQDSKAGQQGNRHNSGPLSGENGGTGNAEGDFNALGGSEDIKTNDKGHQVAPNGVRLRPGTESSGPRIDVPANGDKPHETLHYPQ